MSLEQLQRLAEDFRSIPPEDFDELADSCRELAINHLDVRYMILGECLHLSSRFWGDGEGGAVSTDFADALARIWGDYLPGVLRTSSEEEGTAVALALREELSLTMKVEEAAVLRGISRAHADEMVRRGELPSVRLGRRIVIPDRADCRGVALVAGAIVAALRGREENRPPDLHKGPSPLDTASR